MKKPTILEDCPRTPCPPLRAFRVTCVGLGDPIVHIVKHVTPQAAKFAGFMVSEKAFCGLHIRQFNVVRSPEFDPAPLEKGLLYDEIRAEEILENAGGMARELAAHDSESTTDLNG